MRNITGPPVEGDDFFGREKEIEYVWSRIQNGNNLIFPSPRRVGKTSFAFKIADRANQEGWRTVKLNLEKVTSEQKFIELFIEELKNGSQWEKIKDKAVAVIDFLKPSKTSVNVGGAEIELEWKSKKANVYSQLAALLDHGEGTLIFFDELTVLLTSIVEKGENGIKDVTDFLHWLRDLRITEGSKIRWIFCSSVGIENFTHKHRISDTINDMHDYSLRSYPKEVSKPMLKNLGENNDLEMTDALQEAIVNKLDYCLPFFLQIIFEKIKNLVAIDGLPLDAAIVNTAYNALSEEKHFNTWVERIEEQYEDNQKYAFIMLRHICQEHGGSKRENLHNVLVKAGLEADAADHAVSLLIYMLTNDGYLFEEGRLYRFRSPLLRDFWFNRFVK
jgi:AAA+ ATPase superfamily predicted ATPase